MWPWARRVRESRSSAIQVRGDQMTLQNTQENLKSNNGSDGSAAARGAPHGGVAVGTGVPARGRAFGAS
ncbi:MAG: hypothetical protein E6279_10955 [Streptococcus sp.]|nr:hypothetical protein [Streptococcus sp.]